MADEEQILYKVEINQTKAIKESADLERQIIDTKKQLDALNESTKGNTSAQKAAAETNRKLTEQLKALKSQQADVNKEIAANNKVAATSANSIEGMRARLSAMNAEWKRIDIGSARFKELSAAIKKTSDDLKKQEGAVGDTRRNVGNYVKDINVAGINVNALSEGIKKSRDAFTIATASTKQFTLALAGTGIGLIVVALGLLFVALTKLEPVTEKIEAIFKGIGGAIDALVGGVGKFIGNLLSGKGVIDSWNDSMSGMGERMTESAKAAFELAEAEEALRDKTREVSVQNAELEASISKLLLQSRDRTKTEEERIKFLDEASAKERERFNNQKAIADEALRQAQVAFDQAEKNGTLNDDIEDRLAEAKVKVIELTSESADLEEKIAIRRNAINEKAEKDAEKATAAQEKRQEKITQQAEKDAQLRKELENSLTQTYGQQITNIQKKADEFRKAGAEEVDVLTWVATQEAEIKKKRSADYTKSIHDRVTVIQTEGQNEITAIQTKYNEEAALAQGNAARLAEIEQAKNDEIARINQESLNAQILSIQTILQNAQASNEEGATLGVADTILSAEDKIRLETDLAALQLQLSEFHLVESENAQASADAQIAAADKLQAARVKNANSAVELLKGLIGENAKAAKIMFAIQQSLAIADVAISAAKGFAKIAANLAAVPAIIPPAFPNPAYQAAVAVAVKEKISLGIQTGISTAAILAQTIKGFAKGGQLPEGGGMIKGLSHENGGVRFAMGNAIGEADGKKGEAYIINTHHDPRLKAMASAINVAGGGKRFDSGGIVRFADGGLTARAASDPIVQSLGITDSFFQALENFTVVATIEDINAGLQNKMKIEERANV